MTTFVADAAFIIGSRHTCVAMPCQDYARAAPNVVVVSDGCSSGAHTDLGARQWNLAALDAWNQVPLKNPEQYLEQLLKAGQQRTATMPLLDTLATVAIGAVEDQMLRGFLLPATRLFIRNICWTPSTTRIGKTMPRKNP